MARARVILVFVLLLAIACAVAVPPLLEWRRDYRRAGLTMVERLERLARTSDPRLNVYLNDQRADLMARDLREPMGIDEEVALRLRYAKQLIHAGRTEMAIEELTDLRQHLREAPIVDLRPAHQGTRLLLMLAYLRLGEQQNCLAAHTSHSCLFPITDAGVHRLPDGSRLAIEEMLAYLPSDPSNLGCRWLLNLAYMTLGEYPDGVPPAFLIDPEAFASEYPLPRFSDVAGGLGLDLVTLSGGCIMDDFDNDGMLDLMISGWGLREQLRYFHNEGNGTFTERTDTAGLRGQLGGLNILQADFDNDGWLDVLVLRGGWLFRAGDHPNSLLRNNGDGTFQDVTERAGLLSFHPTQTAVWGDYNNDGWLDLFVGNESFDDVVHPCELYRNNHDGTFTDVAAAAGIDHIGMVKGVTFGDYDRDGSQDLYLSRYEQPNVLYHNEGSSAGWTFRDATAEAGVAEPLSSFPTWFFDYNNDGWLDLLVAPSENWDSDELASVVRDYLDLPHQAGRCALFRNNADGTFTDVAPSMDLDKVLLAMGSNFGDIDNDGYLDCYFGTGQPSMITLVPNRMFRNDRGRTFQDVTTAGGFGHLQKGHGVAFGDLDNDGDQDIYAVMGGAFSGDVYQNVLFENPGHGHHWITLRLEGVRSNRCAIGARITVEVEDEGRNRFIYRTVGSGGSFGASSLQQEIGLGDATVIRSIEVVWPASGTTQTFTDVDMDRIVLVRELEDQLRLIQLPSFPLGAGPATERHQHHNGPG